MKPFNSAFFWASLLFPGTAMVQRINNNKGETKKNGSNSKKIDKPKKNISSKPKSNSKGSNSEK